MLVIDTELTNSKDHTSQPLIGDRVKFKLKRSSFWHEGVFSCLMSVDGALKNTQVFLANNYIQTGKMFFLDDIELWEKS